MGSLRKLGLTNKETSAVSGLRLGSDTMRCLDSCDLGVPQMPWCMFPSPTLLPRIGLPTQTALTEVAGRGGGGWGGVSRTVSAFPVSAFQFPCQPHNYSTKPVIPSGRNRRPPDPLVPAAWCPPALVSQGSVGRPWVPPLGFEHLRLRNRCLSCLSSVGRCVPGHPITLGQDPLPHHQWGREAETSKVGRGLAS